MIKSKDQRNILRIFSKNCWFASIAMLLICTILFEFFQISNFMMVLLFIFCLNWFWGSSLHQLSVICYDGKPISYVIGLVIFLGAGMCFLVYMGAFYKTMLSSRNIFILLISFIILSYIATVLPMKELILNNKKICCRIILCMITYMLIMLVPIFLFGVYDYCIYHSNIIDDLNNKSSMHQLYDILNQGVKVITNEHENEKIIFLILWVMGTFFTHEYLSDYKS